MTLSQDSTVRRRRGVELEDALLEAAWAELEEHGYDAMTIDGVATRAGTSRPVIYRRWKGKPELVLAAITHEARNAAVDIPNTGSLRDDLVAVLLRANTKRAGVAVLFTSRMGEFFRDSGLNLADVRESMLGGRRTSVDLIIQQAVDRGEVDPARLTPRITQLPFDLYRQEFMMTFRPVPREVIEEIVDTIFLPLVRAS